MSRPLPPRSLWTLLRTLSTLTRRGRPVPTDRWEWQAPALRESEWRAYAEALGYPPLEQAPLCFHYLALQRAQLQRLLAPDGPCALPGLVHLAQAFVRRAPWQAAAPWTLRLAMAAEDGPGGAAHLRLSAAFAQQGQTVLEAETLYLLARRAPATAAAAAARTVGPPAPESAEPLAPLARWALPADTGRRYARLSGDANPIHFWAWSARWFGQRQAIAHGMHSAARCEAELMRHHGQPLAALHIRFRRPLALPGTACLHRDGASGFLLADGAGRRVAEGDYRLALTPSADPAPSAAAAPARD